LSLIVYGREPKSYISKFFSNEQLFIVHFVRWYADIVNYLVGFVRVGLGMIETDSSAL